MWGPGHDPVETALEQKGTEFCNFFFIEIQQSFLCVFLSSLLSGLAQDP